MIGKQITELNAAQLGLLKLSDFNDLDASMDEATRKQYVARVSEALEWLIPELKFMETCQLRHIGESSENWEQVLIARGTINAAAVLIERFTKMNAEHQTNIKPKEEFDPHNPIAE